jgi:hypothetical protein
MYKKAYRSANHRSIIAPWQLGEIIQSQKQKKEKVDNFEQSSEKNDVKIPSSLFKKGKIEFTELHKKVMIDLGVTKENQKLIRLRMRYGYEWSHALKAILSVRQPCIWRKINNNPTVLDLK